VAIAYNGDVIKRMANNVKESSLSYQEILGTSLEWEVDVAPGSDHTNNRKGKKGLNSKSLHQSMTKMKSLKLNELSSHRVSSHGASVDHSASKLWEVEKSALTDNTVMSIMPPLPNTKVIVSTEAEDEADIELQMKASEMTEDANRSASNTGAEAGAPFGSESSSPDQNPQEGKAGFELDPNNLEEIDEENGSEVNSDESSDSELSFGDDSDSSSDTNAEVVKVSLSEEDNHDQENTDETDALVNAPNDGELDAEDTVSLRSSISLLTENSGFRKLSDGVKGQLLPPIIKPPKIGDQKPDMKSVSTSYRSKNKLKSSEHNLLCRRALNDIIIPLPFKTTSPPRKFEAKEISAKTILLFLEEDMAVLRNSLDCYLRVQSALDDIMISLECLFEICDNRLEFQSILTDTAHEIFLLIPLFVGGLKIDEMNIFYGQFSSRPIMRRYHNGLAGVAAKALKALVARHPEGRKLACSSGCVESLIGGLRYRIILLLFFCSILTC
jgi:hypothetical protein